MLEDVGKYKGAQGLEVNIWPGSGLKQSRSKWIVAGELIETTQRYARMVARIELDWIERLAQHLIKYSFDEPHFSQKQGSALVVRRGSLYGLPVSPRVSVPLAPIDPALARKLLIEQGLAENELVSRAKFWQHNQLFLEQVKELGDKTRRRDLVIDPFVLTDFYRTRIPAFVVDRVTLEKWDRTLSEPAKGGSSANLPQGDLVKSPYLSWEAISVDLDKQEVEEQYPEKLAMGVSQLPLRYRYEPGDQADGVSLVVPQSIVHQLHHERLEWLVPGLLEEKLACLIKSLPKRLRRQLVPVPDTVNQLLPKLIQKQQQQAPFWKSLCDIVSEFIREPVKQSDFDLQSLPEHLRMRVELVDDQGKPIQASRDLVDLQQSQMATASAAGSTMSPEQKTKYDWSRSSLETWDIETLPKSVVELRGGVRINRFPTLVTDKDKIRTELVDHEPFAEQLFRRGMTTLFARIERREIRSQIQFLPQWSSCSLWLSDRYAGDRLRELVGDLIARLAFIDTNWTSEQLTPVFRTRVEFDISRLKRLERIAGAAAEVGRWLPRFAEANFKVRSLLEKSPASWSSNGQSVREQLAALFDESLSYLTPWCFVRETPRFLQAVAVRLERLKTIGPVKDLEIDAVVSRYWQCYLEQLARAQPPLTVMQSIPTSNGARLEANGKLLEYRWLIEELRVSLHAQQLGTRVSVSPKRLDKLLIACESSVEFL